MKPCPVCWDLTVPITLLAAVDRGPDRIGAATRDHVEVPARACTRCGTLALAEPPAPPDRLGANGDPR